MSSVLGPLEVLSGEGIQAIHQAALRVLEEVGCGFPHPEVLDRLHGAGAHVDSAAQTVRIPAQLVEACADRFPPGFAWRARNPAHTIQVDGSATHFTFPDSAVHMIDLAVTSTGVTPPDLSSRVLEAWHTLACFTHSSQPVMAVCRNEQVSHQTLRMAEAVAESCALPGGHLPIVASMNPASPLLSPPQSNCRACWSTCAAACPSRSPRSSRPEPPGRSPWPARLSNRPPSSWPTPPWLSSSAPACRSCSAAC